MQSDPTIEQILRTVHYGELPTVYPPVSQLVFVAAAQTTPAKASVAGRICVMKSWLLLFDVGTIWLIVTMLRRLSLPATWSIVYAWCPLVLKEVANSGHLDAIAILFTTAAVAIGVRWLANPPTEKTRVTTSILASSLLLAAGVGAKLYPVILVPWFGAMLLKHTRWPLVAVWLGMFLVASFAFMAPMLPRESTMPNEAAAIRVDDSTAEPMDEAIDLLPPPPLSKTEIAVADPSRGLNAYLRYWEMNDFLFLLIVENITIHEEASGRVEPWFSIVPRSVRRGIVVAVSTAFSLRPDETPFLLTRFITIGIFGLIAVWAAWKTYHADARGAVEYAFLTIAWFWMLLPAQIRGTGCGDAGVCRLCAIDFGYCRVVWFLLYYSRFWWEYHAANIVVFGTPYQGAVFFDYVVCWLEFAPWLVLLVYSHKMVFGR